jgi:hypothetical protein
VIQIAIVLRAERLRRPYGAQQHPDPTGMNAANAPRRRCAVMHAPQNSKRQRNRLILRRIVCSVQENCLYDEADRPIT